MIARRGVELRSLEKELGAETVHRFELQMASGDGSLYRPSKIDLPTRTDILKTLQNTDFLEGAGFSRTPARNIRNKCGLLNSGLELEVKM